MFTLRAQQRYQQQAPSQANVTEVTRQRTYRGSIRVQILQVSRPGLVMKSRGAALEMFR